MKNLTEISVEVKKHELKSGDRALLRIELGSPSGEWIPEKYVIYWNGLPVAIVHDKLFLDCLNISFDKIEHVPSDTEYFDPL